MDGSSFAAGIASSLYAAAAVIVAVTAVAILGELLAWLFRHLSVTLT